MPFEEVFTSGVPEERKRLICEQSVAAVMEREGAPDSPAARAIPRPAWQEVSARSIGAQPVSPTQAPCHLVQISVPAESLTEQRNAQIIGRVTAALAAADDQLDRFSQSPSPRCMSSTSPRARGGRLAGRCGSHRSPTPSRPAPSLRASNQPLLRNRPIKEAPQCR